MPFIADKQTLEDLNLLGKYKPNSIYSLFNKTRTGGGERLLQEMFQHPLTDAVKINERSRLFQYFQTKELIFPFSNEAFTVVENYLGLGTTGSYPVATADIIRKKMMGSFLRDEQYEIIHTGLITTIEILNTFRDFLGKLEDRKDNPYEKECKILKGILTDVKLDWLPAERHVKQLPVMKVAKYDHLLKHKLEKKMKTLLESIYSLDVYIAVSDVARTGQLSYAEALPKEQDQLHTTGLRHPALVKGIANPLNLDTDTNMLFLTGANMAGKSTFMKSFGIAVYMAHMGFPVAATDMKFSIRDGLYSSINVPDNLNMGYSHFYAEVLRVKTVAEEVSAGKSLVVLFDELFKGTNVKDAYDATLSVTKSFSEYRNCFFVISTHIIEVGEELRKQCHNLQFSYLPTVMEGTVPKYTYRMTEGITSDRHGMMIIENERILEMMA